MSSAPDYLLSALAHLRETPPRDRPHITLTYAQSLDGKIAGRDGKQLILSGKESMIMTHWMRTMHEGIMIGVGTAVNDDPQLNARHLPTPNSHPLPRPIILDPTLRTPPTCKLLNNYNAHTGRQPWIFCATPLDNDRAGWQDRYDALSQAGAFIIQLESSQSLLPLSVVLQKLVSLGVNSLMVEGGARVINSFLQHNLSVPLIDVLIVTVAPTLVGTDGLSYASSGIPRLQHSDTRVVGHDAVLILKKMD